MGPTSPEGPVSDDDFYSLLQSGGINIRPDEKLRPQDQQLDPNAWLETSSDYPFGSLSPENDDGEGGTFV